MAPINETHSEVAGVTPHGQPRTLPGAADDGHRAKARATTATPPGHARHPNTVHGVRTGDLARVLGRNGWIQGRAQVEAGQKRVTAKNAADTAITSRQTRILRLAPRNGYAESN